MHKLKREQVKVSVFIVVVLLVVLVVVECSGNTFRKYTYLSYLTGCAACPLASLQ